MAQRLHVVKRVCGCTDNEVASEDFARLVGVHVVFSKMHAVELQLLGDVDVVVDHEDAVVNVGADFLCALCRGDNLIARGVLHAQLHPPASAVDGLPYLLLYCHPGGWMCYELQHILILFCYVVLQ